MNSNFEKEPKDTNHNEPNYHSYSEHYTPNGTRYSEQTVQRATAVRRSPSQSPLFIVGIVCLVLLLLIGAIFGTSVYMTMRYEKLLSEQAANQTPSLTDPEEGPSQGFSDDPLFLPSGEDSQLTVSDTASLPTKGEVGDSDLTVSDVVALVGDTVVEIVTSEAYRNGLVYESGAGSGVIVNESGVIVTNYHVIESASAINVRLTNGHTYPATLIAGDADSDLAVLKIDPTEPLSYVSFGKSENVITGETVIAIGNPLGLLGGTVTDGIISATSREVTVEGGTMTLLQHNAAISPGNSGGALFNLRGELIGIVNAKYSSDGAEGLGFAIPSDTVVAVYNDLITYGYVKGRPDTGITLGTMYYNYFSYAICITESRYTNELLPYDVVISIDGQRPTGLAEAQAMLKDHEIGEEVTLVISRTENRKETQHTVVITVEEYHP